MLHMHFVKNNLKNDLIVHGTNCTDTFQHWSILDKGGAILPDIAIVPLQGTRSSDTGSESLKYNL